MIKENKILTKKPLKIFISFYKPKKKILYNFDTFRDYIKHALKIKIAAILFAYEDNSIVPNPNSPSKVYARLSGNT
jgi:hypothetical protein